MGGICSAPVPEGDEDYGEKPSTDTRVSPRADDEKAEDEPDKGRPADEDEEEEEDLSDAGVWGRESINPHNLDNADEVDVEDMGFCVRSDADLKGDPLFQAEDDDGGECFMAVKPWIGAIHEPDNAPSNNPAAPDASLELEWVYGYRGHDSRSNVKINTEGHIVYPAAGVVVKYDYEGHRQEHFQGHTDDVVCLAQNPKNPDIVASGQVATIVNRRATLPHLCVWNTRTGEKWTMPKMHKRAIRNLCFSPCGNYIASVGNDNNYTIIVWDWRNQTALAVEKSGTDEMNEMEWNPVKTDEFVVAGKNCVWICTFDGTTITRKRGAFGSHERSIFYAVAFSPGRI